MENLNVLRQIVGVSNDLRLAIVKLGFPNDRSLFASCAYRLGTDTDLKIPAMYALGVADSSIKTLVAIWIKVVLEDLSDHNFRMSYQRLSQLMEAAERYKRSKPQAAGFYSDEIKQLLDTSLKSLSSLVQVKTSPGL